MTKTNPPHRSVRHAWICVLVVCLLGGAGCTTADQQVESSALPDQATSSIGSIVQIDPPAVVSGAGSVATVPTLTGVSPELLTEIPHPLSIHP